MHRSESRPKIKLKSQGQDFRRHEDDDKFRSLQYNSSTKQYCAQKLK